MAGEKVLIIDDSAELRASLEAILLFGGYTTICATTGQEGLVLATRAQPDVILIDLELPDTTGLKLLEQFNEEGLVIPTVMMTGYGSEGTAARALQLGVRDYLIKPFTTEEVLASVERALVEGRLRRERERLLLQVEDYSCCLGLLEAIGNSITSAFDADGILQRIVKAGQSLTRAEQGSLLLLSSTVKQLQVVAARETDSIAEALSPLAGDERLLPVLREGVAVRLHAGAGDPIEIQTGDVVTAVVQVPLRAQDRVLGLLTMERRDAKAPFLEYDEQVLKLLAIYAVIALEKAGRVP